jgi:hypothetical protein
MTMRTSLLLLLAGLALAAPPVRADEIVLGLENAMQGESNLFKTSIDEVADGAYELSPSILFRRRGDSRLIYEVFYQPTYNVYFKNEGVNGWDQFLRASGEFAPTEVGRAWARLNLTDYRSVRASDAPVDGIPDLTQGGQGRVHRLFFDGGYDHELTRLTRVETAIGLQSYRFDTPNNVDSIGFGGVAALRHQFLPFADGGFSMFASFRQYEEKLTQPGSHNVVLNPNFLLAFEPVETLVLDLSVGPAWVHTMQSGGGSTQVDRFRGGVRDGTTFGAVFSALCIGEDGLPQMGRCPLIEAPALSGMLDEKVTVDFPPGQTPASIDDNLVTAFAKATVTKTENWGYVEAEYFRKEDAAAGSGSTTLRDSITGRIVFHPGYRLDVQLRANWNRRQATSDINQSIVQAGVSTVSTGDGRFFAQSVALIPNVNTNDIEIKQIWADVTIGRPIFLDDLRLEGRFQYLQQKRTDQPIVGTFDNFFGELRLIYRFTAFEY